MLGLRTRKIDPESRGKNNRRCRNSPARVPLKPNWPGSDNLKVRRWIKCRDRLTRRQSYTNIAGHFAGQPFPVNAGREFGAQIPHHLTVLREVRNVPPAPRTRQQVTPYGPSLHPAQFATGEQRQLGLERVFAKPRHAVALRSM